MLFDMERGNPQKSCLSIVYKLSKLSENRVRGSPQKIQKIQLSDKRYAAAQLVKSAQFVVQNE